MSKKYSETTFYVFQFTEIHYQMIWLAVSTLRMWFAFFLLDGSGREILSFREIGACRVGMSLCGSLPRGALLVGHSFRWRFLIGMGGGACCAVFVGFAYLVPLFVGLPRGVVVLVNHSFRRRNLIGTWGRCLFCGVTHWDPIMWIFFCIYLSWCCATWGCYLG